VKYISTRGQAPGLPFDDVLLAGLAADGGLYLPDAWPRFSAADIGSMKGMDYAGLAVRVMKPFIGGAIADEALSAIAYETCKAFDHADIAPLKKIGGNEWLLELFHGPTLAFKDYAMQFLGRFFDHVLKERGRRVTIIGATSGDTGSAAIEACRDRGALDVFIFHPEGRVSEVQRRQMTTVLSANIHNVAIRGTFDDCQALVKAMFNDAAFRGRCRPAAVNSINWARIMAQIVYYFRTVAELDAAETGVSFAVPTGNFGNAFAGYAAKRCGLPVGQIMIGSNRNDILTRFFASGAMQTSAVQPTISPSMDIQVSSNFERLLFDLCGRDGNAVAKIMDQFRATGRFDIGPRRLAEACKFFSAARTDDAGTKAVIREIYEQTGKLIDPHTAVGLAAGRKLRLSAETPLVCIATAHPAKFPGAVEDATGARAELPEHLADLAERPERFDVLDNDIEAVKAYVSERIGGDAP
jgi:threonine synthase